MDFETIGANLMIIIITIEIISIIIMNLNHENWKLNRITKEEFLSSSNEYENKIERIKEIRSGEEDDLGKY